MFWVSRKDFERDLSLYFSILGIFGQLLMFFLWWLLIINFMFFLSLLVRWFLLYTSCVHEAPYAFNHISINYQRKEKEKEKENDWVWRTDSKTLVKADLYSCTGWIYSKTHRRHQSRAEPPLSRSSFQWLPLPPSSFSSFFSLSPPFVLLLVPATTRRRLLSLYKYLSKKTYSYFLCGCFPYACVN